MGEIIEKNAGDLLALPPRLVDEYKKEDKISYAYRMVFQSKERTLTDEEVNGYMEKIYAVLKNKNFEIR
jgi:phenylalanyl-tRNA synthetase beta subunit